MAQNNESISDAAVKVDENKIQRDYAVMRLEHLSSLSDKDLVFYSKGDITKIADEFHRAQILVMMQSRDEFKVSIDFEKVYILLIARIESLKPSSVPKFKPASKTAQTSVVQAKLPKINIRPFDGRKDQWLSFIEIFNSLIHNREDISPVEKLHYLLASVQNEAFTLIKNYPLCEESYQLCYNALQNQYNDPRLNATLYYEKLLNCESVKSSRYGDLERLHQTFKENLSILEKFEQPDKNFMLLHMLLSKLDKSTREQFELSQESTDIPLYEDLLNFIEKRYRALGAADTPHTMTVSKKQSKCSFIVSATCCMCEQPHNIWDCPQFVKLEPEKRFLLVKNKNLCINCLKTGHSVKQCKNKKCSQCKYSHHDLLHFPKPNTSTENNTSCVGQLKINMVANKQVLFATASVLIRNNNEQYVPVRALLDSASSTNFITKDCATKIGLKVKPGSSQSVTGIGQIKTKPLGTVKCQIKPFNSNTSFQIDALVLSTICPELPVGNIDMCTWKHIKGLTLADPQLDQMGPIDILLNAEVYAKSLLGGVRHGDSSQPTAIETCFGWILMGGYNCADNTIPQNLLSFFVETEKDTEINNSIKKFWELEEVPHKISIPSQEDVVCENIFNQHFHRSSDGKFVVPLPFVPLSSGELVLPEFTGTRSIASQRFLTMEKKLLKVPALHKKYIEAMEDYFLNNHMEAVEPPDVDCGKFYYIPQLTVSRKDSATTPLRTVFNASCPDFRGNSLNSKLLAGPKLQNSIFDITLRFRWHAVVFTADIKQMYRQCWIEPAHADYQRILYRSNPEEPLKDFKLKTVTFGVSSAPFLALRAVAQLVEESKNAHPAAAEIIARDVYVDDFVTGANTLEEAFVLRDELRNILLSGGFLLRKWTSNCDSFLVGLETSELYSENVRCFESFEDTSLKVLGLIWQPLHDNFSFNVVVEDSTCTKRHILSEIARIFDPLGFLTPLSFFAKYLIQKLWSAGVGWDDQVPDSISREWSVFKSELQSLDSLVIPRRMVGSFEYLELHGFCDASERGFCAVIYCRSVYPDGSCAVKFCCAKSKIAPLRTISIPRLELQGAVLLSDLFTAVFGSLESVTKIKQIFAWCDSSVALAWIKSCPSRWKTFVANRVSHIQDNVAPENWRHVPTEHNPADCGSRGLLPSQIINHELWWNGPSFLSENPQSWPNSSSVINEELTAEEKKVQSLVSSANVDLATDLMNLMNDLMNRFSSFRTIKHLLAYIFRFLHNIKVKDASKRLSGPLSPCEIDKALVFLVQDCQKNEFASEMKCLRKGEFNSLPKSFRKLSPFLDEAGSLRVGGRLANADVAFDIKHPLLLPSNHRLTFLIIDEYHRKFLHPGAQTLQNLLSQHFWILAPKRSINSVISKCYRCFRARPVVAVPPFMGNLPGYRINQVKPFVVVAVDFGGPFNISLGRFRGSKTYKAYVCVFVCTSTKAVHLELVSDLTAEAFIAALRRFVSRRGRCNKIISDQGTNFVGASNILKRVSGVENINFEFNPPGSPHFSGLVEAGVKSVKTHLARVIGLQRLTFEEFYTLLTQIEALLNSRPLTPLSSDPKDLSPLTPGHFLTLQPLTSVVDNDLVDVRVGLTQRWKLVQQMQQSFWARWRLEYMHTLQQRTKWTSKQENIKIGTLVIIIDEQKCNPMHWRLGRIVDLHPGVDGICRVVTVRTASGLLRRPVVKLCPLPNAE